MSKVTLEGLGLGADDLAAIGKLSEKGMTPEQIADAVEKVGQIKSSASEIDEMVTNGAITIKSIDSKMDKYISRNLIDPNSITPLSYINSGGGIIPTTYPLDVTGPIIIEDGQTIIGNFGVANTYSALYDINGTYIANTAVNSNIITNNLGHTAYARMSISGRYVDGTTQAEYGTISTAYQKYESITDITTIMSYIDNKLEKNIGKNLYNKNHPDIIFDKYLSSANTYLVLAGYVISHYIPIKNGQTLTANIGSGGAYNFLYDVNKNPISSAKGISLTGTTGSAYARFSFPYSNSFQVEEGTASTTYEDYTEYSKIYKNLQYRDIKVVLPSTLYLVKGLATSLYYDNVITKNIEDKSHLFFNYGLNYSRQNVLNFATAGDYIFIANLSDCYKKRDLQNFNLKVIDKSVNSGKVVNMLSIGDSFTDIGTWHKTVKNLLVADGVTVNEIGTCGSSTYKVEGLSGGTLKNTFLDTSVGVARIITVSGMTAIPQTGYPGTTYTDSTGKDWIVRGGKITGGNGKLVVTKSGATTADFSTFPPSGILTKKTGQASREGDDTIIYSASTSGYSNQFINPTTGLLDITNYITSWGFNSPNLINIQFTWNDTSLWQNDFTTLIGNFKTAINHIHLAYPNCKIILSIEPFGSANATRDVNGKKYSVLNFVKALESMVDTNNYASYVYLAPSYAFVDTVNGYSDITITPSARYPSVTEKSGGDGVHPSTNGMEQIGECVYQVASHII